MGSCEQVRAEAPEVLVLMQCGASPQGALPCVSELAALPGWWGLPAVKNGWVFVVDHAPFLRPGPRVVRAAPFQSPSLTTHAAAQALVIFPCCQPP